MLTHRVMIISAGAENVQLRREAITYDVVGDTGTSFRPLASKTSRGTKLPTHRNRQTCNSTSPHIRSCHDMIMPVYIRCSLQKWDS